jgi:hypothetical protein
MLIARLSNTLENTGRIILINAVIGKVESGPKPLVRSRESSGSAREADEVMRSDYTDFPITLETSFRDS